MIITKMRVHYDNKTLKKTWQPSTDKKDKKLTEMRPLPC